MLDQLDAEDSLLGFVRYVWHIIEPGRTFVEGRHIHAICEHLEAVSRGEIKRLLINVPPGFMKSLLVNVLWPAWEWGPRNRPDLRYVSAAYSQDLTIRDNRRGRHIILSDEYQRAWGDRFQLSEESNAKVRYDTNHTGFRIATSVAGLGTGERGDRFIIDDPHNVRDADSEAKREGAIMWFTEVVPTRLNDPAKSAIVIIMQRVHERDVSGLILSKSLGYDHLCLPMEFEPDHPTLSKTALNFTDWRTEPGELLWPNRFTHEVLERDKGVLRAWGGTYAEAGQLQQRPAPRGGGMFQRKDFTFVDSAPTNLTRVVRGWDLAASKDGRAAWTVGVKLGRDAQGRIFILDVRRGRWTPGEVKAQLLAAAHADGRKVCQDLPQDPGQAGKAQKADLAAHLSGFDVRFGLESGAKEDRARPLAAQGEAGNIYLVRAPWNDAFVSEAIVFPNGEYLDQIDASSRAYARLIIRREETVGAAPTLVEG